ncbi:hypothetical protein LshimejAT787_1100740 [Lyophyllum shimeji]|uniref:Uncharacterized protein n=1 Tax=Lyophyllum shimeji TaxID=47721 RepID=A0A9P3PV40_LYOSH|nr:hypothetical protein LshimejAT787_1100740 [Lyophyllum shimeji]
MPARVTPSVVTWIGASRAPRTFFVPPIRGYYPFTQATHTLIVDISPQDEELGDQSEPSLRPEVFFQCLEMIVRSNGQTYPRIDVLRFECTNPDKLPGRRVWAVLGALRPLYLDIAFGEPETLSLPRLSSLVPQASVPGNQTTVVSNFADWRYNLKYGTPRLFSDVYGLKIVHPLAIDLFVRLCEEYPGLATQLRCLGLLSSQTTPAQLSRTCSSQEFGVALSRCTSLTHLVLTAAEHDVDVTFCRMLPSYFSNSLLHLRVEGPTVMARYCQRWIKCARTKTWLPELTSLACNLVDRHDSRTNRRSDQSQLEADAEALTWEMKFIEAMTEHRPNIQILR